MNFRLGGACKRGMSVSPDVLIGSHVSNSDFELELTG